MAEIPVSTVVNVQISTTPVAPSRAGFGTLLFVTTAAENAAAINPITLGVGVVYYASIDEVAVDWNTTDEVYIAAQTYFSQSPRPTRFAVGARDAGDANVSATLTRLLEKSNDWYFVAFEKATRDIAEIDEISQWTEARVKQFFTASNDANSVIAGDQTDVLFDLNDAGYKRTALVYDDDAAEYPEVSAVAREAIVQFDQPDSTITMNLKQLPTITPVDLTSGELAALIGKGGNAYVTIGGVDAFREGIMVAGVGTWMDTIHGVDWLQNAIETNIYGYLYTRTTKVPLTNKGAQAIATQIENALDEGVNNGLIAPGFDADGNFLQKGYEITVGLVEDMPLADRQARKCPPITFKAIGAGAIHSVTVTGIFEG